MDIQTKDGIFLRGIPDGTPDEIIKTRIQKIRAEGGGTPQQPAPQAAPQPPLTNDNPNPIDKFILDKFSPQLAKMPDIQGSMPGRFVQGLSDLPIGALQLAANASKEYPGLAETMNRGVSEMNARTENLRGQDKGSFDFARLAGNIANPAGWAAGGALPAATSVAGKVGLGAALGAGYGAATPVTQGDDFWKQKATQTGLGAATGAVFPLAASGASLAGRTIRNIADPWLPGGVDRAVGRTANAAAGDKKEAIIRALKEAKQIVPGSIPNAGEAAAPVGRAEFSGLQEVVKGRTPSSYENITQAQNAARVNALRGVGRNKEALERAISGRAADAAENYGKAGRQLVKSDQILSTIMQRPSMEKVLSRATDLAKEQGRPFKFGKDTPEQIVAGRIIGASGVPLSSYTIPASRSEFPVDSLHYIKMAMDDLIKNPERFGIGAAEAQAIARTQKQFVEWIGNKSPAYDIARSTFASQSKPINQMEIGQYLENKLTPALNDQGFPGSQRATAYAQAIRDAQGTIKRSTGQPRYDDLAKVLEPEQMAAVTNVGSDLARTATHERLAKAGTEKARELVGQIAPKLPAGGMFSPPYSVTRAISNRIAGRVEGKSLDKLSESMQNPQELAKLMEGLAPKERTALAKLLRKARVPAYAGAVNIVEQGQQP